VRLTPLHPRQITAITLAAMAFAAALLLATAQSAGSLDVSLGSGGSVPRAAQHASTAALAIGPQADPLAPALRSLDHASPLTRAGT
jgi:hypothetical protein